MDWGPSWYRMRMDQESRQYLEAGSAASKATWEAMEERIVARLERFEVDLLEAFRDLACPAQARVPNVATRLKGFYERRALAEQRISELERKRPS
jgi:hypothetical protein